jgi:hypothetical protein
VSGLWLFLGELFAISNFRVWHEGHIEEENNGYVVLKWNIPGSAGIKGGGEGGEAYPFLQQASGQIFKDDVNEFFSTLEY